METRWNDGTFTSHVENLVWTASSTVRRYLHRLVSGTPDCDWLTYVEWKHLPPRVDRALVLGCGSGWLERALSQRGRFERIVACDFAPATVERARKEAQRLGLGNIEYRVLDLEHEPLDGPYGAIFANDVLHHITDLEGICGRIRAALAPDGRFLFNEYVGPNRFQYTDERMDFVNRYFRLLSDDLRRDPFSGAVLWRRERLSAEQVIQEDPTEAVRSEDVLPVARASFRVEREYRYGGGLLNPLLYGVVVNFRHDDADHVSVLETLCGTEERLSGAGEIESDFSIFVGTRGNGA
ncbi:MAG TPA: class I SAM-dependent methyltransferase [Thermoanaerobaculia bacterium]|nr:class I SAM-dependent methyltransferase [Thermoanaerobaculia bacterium]